ncbi:MAG: efflux RND transporter periplasmic adaptor subunit [Geminicoccaceae bacterium]|nr:MAG: efflux RND transporter periplasmic adaptor subunit [Geminicoccaceae bacterium]
MRRSWLAGLVVLAAPMAMAQSFDCVMEPSLVVRLGSPAPGLLADARLQRGDLVRKGEVVARLVADVEAATVELLAEQAASRAEVEAQEARLQLSTGRLARSRTLADRGIASREQLEEVAAEVEVVRRELAMAELRHRLAALELGRAERVLEQRAIRSPIDGIVVERVLSAGEYVPQDGHIAIIAALDPLHVEAFLPARHFPYVHEGQVGQIRPAAPIEGSFEARITTVDRVFDAASATFGIRLTLTNPDATLPAGHRCRLDLDLANPPRQP